MKLKTLFTGTVLTLIMESAFAVPVVLDITFDSEPQETAFGIWETATAPDDIVILLDPFTIFDGPLFNINPSIGFDPLASSPLGNMDGFAPVFSFSLAFPGDPYHFDWDLAIGEYTLIVFDFFPDGIAFPGGYSVSVDGSIVGSGSGLPFEIERTEFSVAAVPEPGTLTLMILGLIGFGATRRTHG